MTMRHKIFDNQGFLNKDGKTFVNDGFTKEVRKVLKTAEDENDILIISSILKNLIGDFACEEISKIKAKSLTKDKDSDINTSISSEESKKLISKNSASSVPFEADLNSLINFLS